MREVKPRVVIVGGGAGGAELPSVGPSITEKWVERVSGIAPVNFRLPGRECGRSTGIAQNHAPCHADRLVACGQSDGA
jgi:hypothetical protein